jgi:hypothetical protein
MRRFAWVAVALGTIAAPILFLVGLRLWTEDELEGVTFDPSPLVVTPTEREIRDTQRVNVLIEWDQPVALRAPRWAGLVTAVYVEPGMEITQGQRVVAIDGVDRVAFARPAPFHRTLASEAEGPDVALLHDLLLTLGLIEALPADPEFFSFATALAVESLNVTLGAGPSMVFDPSVVIWMPFAPFPVAEADLEVGVSAPAADSTIATGPMTLVGARLESSDPTRPLTFEPETDYVLVRSNARVAVDTATSAVRDADLGALAALVEPLAERTDATVERETTLRALAIPAPAVMTNASGALCVWVIEGAANGARGAYRATPVVLAGSRSGVTDVVAGLSPGDQMLANPADVLGDPRCP